MSRRDAEFSLETGVVEFFDGLPWVGLDCLRSVQSPVRQPVEAKWWYDQLILEQGW